MFSIKGREIGEGKRVFVIAEIGINHNGDIETAKRLVKEAKDCGCDAVKFQKRTVDEVYTREELLKPRESPFGTTNKDLKRGLEFGEREYGEIDAFCRKQGILWTASPWDLKSVAFLEYYNVPFYKIASASITDLAMLDGVRATKKPVIVSVGMSTQEEIDQCLKRLDRDNLALLSCVSLYPPRYDQMNLKKIDTLRMRYQVPIGYSGHETDDFLGAVAVGMGACIVEHHFTLDRDMWGSDQKASLEPAELKTLVKRIRLTEQALGDGRLACLDDEVPVKKKLRRY